MACSSAPSTSDLELAATPITSVRVLGNHLVDQNDQPIQLRGVNRSGTQYTCTDAEQGPFGYFDGPVDTAAINAMLAWKVNAIRVSLNEHCWLGRRGLPNFGSVTQYRQAITDFVTRLTARGLVVIVDLHWAAPDTLDAEERPMANRQNSPAFWTSVATAFKANPLVLFDLYNEPYPDYDPADGPGTTAAWTCVQRGGECGVGYPAAGMQELLTAVRATGARNPVLVAGPQFAGDLSRWPAFKPADSLAPEQLVASIHIYVPEWSPCHDAACWHSVLAPLAAQTPIVIGEVGEIECQHDDLDPVLAWADDHGVSYLAWSWVRSTTTSQCKNEPSLIKDYNGTPTNYGVGYRDHLLAFP